MNSEDEPELRVDDLMREIREEIARGGEVRHAPVFQSESRQEVSLPRLTPDGEPLDARQAVALVALTDLHDQDFVRAVYRVVLGPDTDEAGLEGDLQRLRTGALSKVEIIGRLRYSAAGRKRAQRITGLLPRFLLRSLFRIPVLGYLMSIGYLLLRLPVIAGNLQAIEQFTARGDRQIARHVDGLADVLESTRTLDLTQIDASMKALGARQGDHDHQLGALESRLGHLDDNMSDAMARLDGLDPRLADHDADLSKLHDQNEEVRQKVEHQASSSDRLQAAVADLEIRTGNNNRSFLDQERRLRRILDITEGQVAQPSDKREALAGEMDHLLDAFYVNFEDYFRGARAEVKRRLAVYVSIVREVNSTAPDGNFLDIGCGRGEWLELLKESDIACHGIDLNPMMVEECTNAGLDAECVEVFEYLSGVADNSLAGITGFHIIEHIPFPRLIGLFDEVFRVLRPGGVVIFETPNPENVTVGSYNFYYDPTHLNPLPPGLVKFYAQSRGFSDATIKRVNADALPNPFADSTTDDADISRIQSFLSERFFVAPDYALIAFKP